MAALACNRDKADVQGHNTEAVASSQPEASFATIIVDFSASFAPLTQSDRIGLKEMARGIGDLAVQDWSPPTTIVWRKIGVESTKALPLCDPLEYNRKLVGAVNAAQNLRVSLSGCVDTVVHASQEHGTPEPYTDINDAIMIASESWAHLVGRKTIVILSDFLEDLPKGVPSTSLALHGEHILMLHRPGTTEVANLSSYLERIDSWKRRLQSAGAASVTAIPVFRITAYTATEALREESASGTSVLLVTDLSSTTGAIEVHNQLFAVLSDAISRQAGNWPPPVTATWFGATRPAWHTKTVAPVVYLPRLAHRAEEVNTTDDFKRQLEEWGRAIDKKPDVGNGDIDGVLRLISDGETTPNRVLVLLSEFSNEPPQESNHALSGYRVLMIYSARRAQSGQTFFRNINEWERYFKESGATNVCALDLSSSTEATLSMCLQQERAQ